MNRVLERRRAEPLGRVTQLYGEVDGVFLTTLAEFDHYPNRRFVLTPGPSPEEGRGEQESSPPGIAGAPLPSFRQPLAPWASL